MLFFKKLASSHTLKRSFSCNYDKPFLFGPIFSTFFFGAINTYILMLNITSSHHILKKELEDIKKEIQKNK